MAVSIPPIYILETNIMLVVAAIVALFSVVIVLAMILDYRLYLETCYRVKYSFSNFVKREQYYICLLLFFFFLVALELCMQLVLATGSC